MTDKLNIEEDIDKYISVHHPLITKVFKTKEEVQEFKHHSYIGVVYDEFKSEGIFTTLQDGDKTYHYPNTHELVKVIKQQEAEIKQLKSYKENVENLALDDKFWQKVSDYDSLKSQLEKQQKAIEKINELLIELECVSGELTYRKLKKLLEDLQK